MMLRWGELGSKTVGSTTFKYKVDRWNGAIYRDSFSSAGLESWRESGPTSSGEFTMIWNIALGLNVIWLIYGTFKPNGQKEEPNKNI